MTAKSHVIAIFSYKVRGFTARCSAVKYHLGEGGQSSALTLISLVGFTIVVGGLVFKYLSMEIGTPSVGGTEVHCVLSFGSRGGGASFAKDIQQRIVATLSWENQNVYLDINGLTGKAGTVATEICVDGEVQTAQLNPSWESYYRACRPFLP